MWCVSKISPQTDAIEAGFSVQEKILAISLKIPFKSFVDLDSLNERLCMTETEHIQSPTAFPFFMKRPFEHTKYTFGLKVLGMQYF